MATVLHKVLSGANLHIPFGYTNIFEADRYDNLQAAVTAGAGGVVLLNEKEYSIGSLLTVPDNTTIQGVNRFSTGIVTNSAINMVRLGTGCRISDLYIDGNDVALSGLWIQDDDSCVVRDVRVLDCSLHGLALVGSNYNKVYNLYVSGCGSRGVLISLLCSYNQLFGIHGYDNTNATLLISQGSHDNQVFGVNSESCGSAAIWLHDQSYNNFVLGGTIKGYNGGANAIPAILLGWNSYNNHVSDFKIEDYEIGVLLRGGTVTPGYGLSEGNTRDNRISNMQMTGLGKAVANTGGVKIDSFDSGVTICEDNWINNIKIRDFYYGVFDPDGNGADNNSFDNIDCPNDVVTVTYSLAYTASNSKITNWRGLQPAGYLVSAPAVAATGVNVENEYPYHVMIFLKGMPSGGNVAIDDVYVDAVAAPNDGNGMYLLQSGQNIKLSYGSGTPTWRWYGSF